MKTNKFIRFRQQIGALALLTLFISCERDITELQLAKFPNNPEVFIDGFSAGLNYAAFGGSVPTAFDVDNNVTFNNSAASMRFEVPDAGDPRGSFAGGVFFTNVPRDLSSFNALTFWAKASQSATIGEIGFGNDLGQNKFIVSASGLTIGTGWRKYIIPIPDPARLVAERGMLWYAAGNIDGKGFTFWIDEVRFENLGTIAHPRFTILNGQEQTETSFIGLSRVIAGLTATFNMPNGINQSFTISPSYFQFGSTNPAIATVNQSGRIEVIGGPGNAQITAQVGDIRAVGSLTINSIGVFQTAPTPTQAPASVISLFSEHYTNVPVDYYNGYWEPWQTTRSADFQVGADRILHYVDFNFVGVQFSSPVINATSMTHLHVHVFFPFTVAANTQFRIELVNQTPQITGLFTTTITPAQSQQWISLAIPLSSFSGLTNRTSLWQLIFVDVNANIPNFYADNIFFYNAGGGTPVNTEPTTAAPAPTQPAANVAALFSDAYTMVPGTNFNPGWGQATVVTEIQIQGNKTLRYKGLNYQGIELGSSLNVSQMGFLHLHFWSANSTQLKVFLISPGPVETPVSLTVPTSGWSSINIPLSSFAPVNLSNVFQLKFEGNGDIFLDNIYFYKN